MNPIHLHLILNHLPVIGALFAVLALALALFTRSRDLGRAALGMLLLTGLLSAPAYFSGENSEDAAEASKGEALEALLEPHEEAAELAFVAAGLAGALALGALVLTWRRDAIPLTVLSSGLALALIVFGLMARTATLGGRISHPEVRGETAAAVGAANEATGGAAAEATAGGAEEEEEDE